MKIYRIVLILCILFGSCTPKTHINQSRGDENEFYNNIYGKEEWFVDTLFAGISSVDLRYEHGYVMSIHGDSCLQPFSGILPVFIRNGKIFIGTQSLDTMSTSNAYAKVFKYTHAKEIIELCEKYEITEVRTGHNIQINAEHKPIYIYVTFMNRGDSTLSMQYSEMEAYHKIREDSFYTMKGWSIFKTNNAIK